MTRQDSPMINSDQRIEKWGCAIMSVLFWIEQLDRKACFPPVIIPQMIRDMERFGCFLDNELTVIWDKCFKYFGWTVSVKKESPVYACKDGEFEILELSKPGHTHFLPGDGQGHYTWDPLGMRPQQKDYKIKSKRVFRCLNV